MFPETKVNICDLFRDLKIAEIATKGQEVLLIESDTESSDSNKSVSSTLPMDTWSGGGNDPMKEDSIDNTRSLETQDVASDTSGMCSLYQETLIAKEKSKDIDDDLYLMQYPIAETSRQW